MALIKNYSAVPATEMNPYLDDPAQGLSLVAQIISSKPRRVSREYRTVDWLMDEQLLSFSGDLGLKNELSLYTQLIALSDRLSTPEKYRLLNRRSVVGLGGKFSAGKSCFINSLLGTDQLPVEQSPTTSVPTYIVGGEGGIYAYTVNGAKIPLNGTAVKAISHGFQNTYGLGLAQYIDFIAVPSPSLPWSDLALLDTPGYNKADTNVVQAYSDAEKAYSQLRSVDYLIWLMDVQNGTLTEDDIRFIRRLGLKTKVLAVINKCDLKLPEEAAAVVEAVEKDAAQNGIELFDAVPYSSAFPEADSRRRIDAFFAYAQRKESMGENVRKQVEQIAGQLEDAFTSRQDELEEVRNRIGRALFSSSNPFEVKALVSLYGNLNSQISQISSDSRDFQMTAKKIYWMIDQIAEDA